MGIYGLEKAFYKRIHENSIGKNNYTINGEMTDMCITTYDVCCKCGNDVRPGSGNFVNRVIDANDFDTRVENGDTFPNGNYICPECEDYFDKI